jgi:hypothetical protein
MLLQNFTVKKGAKNEDNRQLKILQKLPVAQAFLSALYTQWKMHFVVVSHQKKRGSFRGSFVCQKGW